MDTDRRKAVTCAVKCVTGVVESCVGWAGSFVAPRDAVHHDGGHSSKLHRHISFVL